jgi:hypothetical protein
MQLRLPGGNEVERKTIMKKLASILCVAAAFVFASQVMADDTYGIHYNNTGPYVPGYWENPDTGERSSGWKDGWTRIEGHNDTIGAWKLNETGQTYTALKDSSLSLNIERNSTDSGFSYGTFQYDSGTGQIVANSEEFIGSVGAGELGSGISVAYSAGDLAGVWVEIEGVKYYSQGTLNANHNTETYQGDAPAGSAYVWFDDAASWPGQDPVTKGKKTTPGAAVKILVTGVAPASSGAPLPGVLATVALCGVVGGYFRRKKNAVHSVGNSLGK